MEYRVSHLLNGDDGTEFERPQGLAEDAEKFNHIDDAKWALQRYAVDFANEYRENANANVRIIEAQGTIEELLSTLKLLDIPFTFETVEPMWVGSNE